MDTVHPTVDGHVVAESSTGIDVNGCTTDQAEAAQLAAETSTGMNVNQCTTDCKTKPSTGTNVNECTTEFEPELVLTGQGHSISVPSSALLSASSTVDASTAQLVNSAFLAALC